MGECVAVASERSSPTFYSSPFLKVSGVRSDSQPDQEPLYYSSYVPYSKNYAAERSALQTRARHFFVLKKLQQLYLPRPVFTARNLIP